MTIDVNANWDGRELDIVASPRGLLEFVSLLRSGTLGHIKINKDSYLDGMSNMSHIDVVRGEGRLVLRVADSSAAISGDERALLLLAKNLENLRLMWAKGGEQHFHFDPESNAILQAPESDAFIVSPVETSGSGLASLHQPP